VLHQRQAVQTVHNRGGSCEQGDDGGVKDSRHMVWGPQGLRRSLPLVHFCLSTALLDSRSYSQCKATSVATYTSMITADLLLPDLLSILCSQSGYCLSSSCALFDIGMCFKNRIQRHHVTSSCHVKDVGLIHADRLLHPSNVVQ
jgi:hypothetical protein